MNGRNRRAGLVLLAVTFLWLGVIWGHSLTPGVQSSSESGFFLQVINTGLGWLGLPQLTEYLVRKGAHVCEYTILGLLLSNCVRVNRGQGREWIPLTLLLGLCVPVLDEFIQLHVDGRGGSVRDVLLDFCGVLLGTLVTFVLGKIRERRRN